MGKHLKIRPPMTIDGIPVIDAKKKVKIVISASDVKRGKNKNPAACAAALACLHDVKGCAKARVHIGRTYLLLKKKWVRYFTPDSLRTEIVSFDRGGGFSPGTYTLSPMTPSDRAVGKRQGGPDTRRTGKKRHRHVTTGVRHFGANR